MSRPSRARGLKLAGSGQVKEAIESRPSRARGLKQHRDISLNNGKRRAPRGRVD